MVNVWIFVLFGVFFVGLYSRVGEGQQVTVGFQDG